MWAAVLSASDAISVATGVDVKGGSYTVAVATDRMWPEVADEAPLLGRGAPADIVALRLVGGAYAELRAELGSVRVVPGARLDGDSLTFSQVASTMMAGSPEAMQQEQAIVAALGNVRGFSIAGDQLTLVDESGRPVLKAVAVALR